MKLKEKSGKNWLKTQHSKNEIMVSGPITSWQIDRKTMEIVTDFIYLGSKITADGDCSHEIKRCSLLGRKSYNQPRRHIKKAETLLTDKCPYSQSYDFSSSHEWMWELDCKEVWGPKNWCFWIVLEKNLESPLDSSEIQPVNPKGLNPEYSLEGLMVKLKF